ncbi:helix-turn-helix domain-containing protein [Salinithrix halophila]|uniref:Helix-turn-helix domain-containing protein n=1 Tax=Salinithrix halophila TaxID=1485204 RepID=A0ABV8JMC5_9BACL
MSRPTDRLLRRRKEAGLTLEQMQQKTNIQAGYLAALEQGEFSALPGKFYTRAFIKAYCGHLGVDAAPILRQFDETMSTGERLSVPVPTEPSKEFATEPVSRLSRKERYSRQKKKRKTRRRGGFPPIRLWQSFLSWASSLPKKTVLIVSLSLVFFASAGVVGFLFFSSDKEGGKPSGTDESSGVQGDSPLPTGNEDKAVVELVKPSETYKYGDLFEVSKAKEVSVTLEAREKTWFRYRAGGPTKKVTKQAKLSAGRSETFRDPSWVSLMVGNPDRVTLRVNGHIIDTSSETAAHSYQLKRKP